MFYVIEEMSFKCLLDVFWTVLPRDVLETQSKVYGGTFFVKINKYYLLTIFAKRLCHRCSRLLSHCEETVYFLPLSLQEFLVLI